MAGRRRVASATNASNVDNGCGLFMLLGLIVVGLGFCGRTETSPPPVQESFVSSTPTVQSERSYVTSSRLNCRTSPNPRARRVTSFIRGEGVLVEESRDGWSRVSSLGATCWVSTRLLSSFPPPVSTPATPRRASRRGGDFGDRGYAIPESSSSRGFQCGGKRVCAQMNSCAEANYYLNQCGLYRLDRDNDGIPCESIC